MATKVSHENPKAGDAVVVEAHRVGGPRRTGVVLEVLGESGSEHYRVRWEDGTETIFYPSSDTTIKHASAA
jgi:hypothetical protein